MPDVLDCSRRQIVPGARAGSRNGPAVHFLIDRLDARLRALRRGKVVDSPPVEIIPNGDANLRESVEHVEFGERDTVDAADLDHLADQGRIEPAAAALAAGHRAKLAPNAPEVLADVAEIFCRE